MLRQHASRRPPDGLVPRILREPDFLTQLKESALDKLGLKLQAMQVGQCSDLQVELMGVEPSMFPTRHAGTRITAKVPGKKHPNARVTAVLSDFHFTRGK